MEVVFSNYSTHVIDAAERFQEATMGFTDAGSKTVTENYSEAIIVSNDMILDTEDDVLWPWTMIDGLLMVAILFGNTLTILAVTMSRRLSSLISNQFVLNLAISDLTVGLTLPYHLAFYLNTKLGKMKVTCVLRFMLIMLACIASILNLIAIAVDRYIAILHPLHYSRYVTKTVTRSLMVFSWVLAVSASVVPIFWNNWGMNNTCDVHKVIPKEYTTNVLAPLFSLVWIVMFVLYWRIWRETMQHARRMRTTTCCQTSTSDWKSVQVVFMVLGSFSLCWMPYVVVVCTQAVATYKQQNQILYKAVFSLAVANSGINPVIYAWKNTGFRRAFLRLLRCQSPDCAEFDVNYRNPPTINNSSERKIPLDNMVAVKQYDGSSINNCDRDKKRQGETDDRKVQDRVVNSDSGIVNGGGVKTERCRIIENMAYDERLMNEASKCHIIENLAFEGSIDLRHLRMIDSSERESNATGSNATISTLPADTNMCVSTFNK